MPLDQIHLETSGKGEKIEKTEAIKRLKDIEDVKVYLAKLSQTASGKNKNPQLQQQISAFLEKGANNSLSQNTDKYNAKKFDTDGEAGLDAFEFERFQEAMKGAIAQIVALDSVGAFDRVHGESREGGSLSNPDKWIAEKVDISKHILGEKGSSSFAEEALKKVGTLSPEELHKMQEKPFSLSVESGKDLALLLAKEVGSGVEDLIRFLTNIPAGAVLLPRYLSYRIDSNSSDLEKKTEGEIKLAELVEANSSLAIVELLGEKGIQMIKQLATMMKSGKQGDIATMLVAIAGLVAGGAGALKLVTTMGRKQAVMSARKAGRISRMESPDALNTRTFREALKVTAKAAGEVAKVSNKVDSIVSGNAALGKVASVAGKGVRKVAPAFTVAANDASNASELERARAKKQEAQRTEAVAQQELKATGTDGPIYGPRMSVNSPFDGVSTEALQNQYELSRIITGQDSRLTQHEGNLMREIQRRTNPNAPEVANIPDKKHNPTPTEGTPSNVVDFAEKQAQRIGEFVDQMLKGGKAPLLFIERNGGIEIGRLQSIREGGMAVVEIIKDGKIQLKNISLEELDLLNNNERRINPKISRELWEKKMKMEQAYHKEGGINPLEVIINSGLDSEKRIQKANKLLGRNIDKWEVLAIDHIHDNISKGIYKNGIGDLKKMAQMWEQMTGNKMTDKAKFAEFRKLVENGVLGKDPEAIAIREASQQASRYIGIYDIDSFLDKIKDRMLSQADLNAVVGHCIKNIGDDVKKLDSYIRDILDVAGYKGDKETMFHQAISYAKEMELEKLLVTIDNIPVNDLVKHLTSDVTNANKILKAFLEKGKPSTKTEFFHLLEENDKLLSTIITGEHATLFIKTIISNFQGNANLIRDIINTDSILQKVAPENLRLLNTATEKMIKDGIYGDRLAETLRSKLAMAVDAKNPKNRIRNFLQNGDDETRKALATPGSSEHMTWNDMFNDFRSKDGGVAERLKMLALGERSFFYQIHLDAFTYLTFPELPLAMQKDFVKKYVAPKDGKYHGLIEEFPNFADQIREHGWI